jgi:hypothetical protein
MYSVMAAAIPLALIGSCLFFACDRGWKAPLYGLFVGAMLGTFFGVLASSMFQEDSPHVLVENQHLKLASMRTTEDVNGVFVWGTGTIGTSTVYRVMILNNDGSMHPFSATADAYTLIVEDANLHGEGLLVEYKEINDPKWRWAKWAFTASEPIAYHYEYHVPKGTVRNTFDAR